MFETFQNLCPQLVMSVDQLDPPPDQDDLLDRCFEFSQTQDFESLSSEQVSALGLITSDETTTMGTMTVEITGQQMAAVAGRLTALRGGAARGLSIKLNQDPLDEISHLFAGPGATSDSDLSSSTSEIGNFGRLGLFVNAAFAGGDRDETTKEPGFDFDHWRFTGGLDYRITSDIVLGGAVGYAQTETDLDNNFGDIDADGYSFALYGSYYVGNYYIDAIGSYARKEYETLRNINYELGAMIDQTFTAETDADEYTFSLGGGYQFSKGGWQFGPYGRFDYLKSEIDAYSEKMAEGGTDAGTGLPLRVDEQDIESFTSVLGGQVSYAISTGVGVITPHLRLDWVHEFANDDNDITAHFMAVPDSLENSEVNTVVIPIEDPDRDYATLGAGLSAVFPHGVLAFVDYETLLALSDVTVHRVTGGVRFEF